MQFKNILEGLLCSSLNVLVVGPLFQLPLAFPILQLQCCWHLLVEMIHDATSLYCVALMVEQIKSKQQTVHFCVCDTQFHIPELASWRNKG